MAQKKKTHLKLAKDPNVEALKQEAKKRKRERLGKWGTAAFLTAMVIIGIYLLMRNQSYTGVNVAASYGDGTLDSNQYVQFADGLVRYSRDGIVFLNRKNVEQWIQPCQMQNPEIDVNEKTFAVADIGGSSILVFGETGLKGEIETTLPIEKLSVSSQGIVSVILKNEAFPMIVTYDATGNILVEHQVTANNTGYPVALDMSADGMSLMVSYLVTKGGALKSRVTFYNFGEAGKSKTDNQVGSEEYDGEIIPEVYYMDDDIAVAVGDSGFYIYGGGTAPKQTEEVKLNQQIQSSFHTEKYIGFVLLNKNKSGYEVRLYGKSGKQVMNKEFTGEYSNVKMVGDEIIMYAGSKGCIITKNEILRFKGDWEAEALEVIPTAGVNRYLVMSADKLRVVYLTK